MLTRNFTYDKIKKREIEGNARKGRGVKMLVSAKDMLTKARAGKYAVGQFNINNLEWTKAILLTAEEMKSPVILGVSEGAGKYMCGFKTVSAHGKSYDRGTRNNRSGSVAS